MSYSILKQIPFCYGHRLMNYEGKCRHLHGHNATAEITIETEALDERGMVVDFGDIKKIAKTWIDENLDHKLLLRKDDPLVSELARRGELHFVMEENPTAENIAKLIFEALTKQGLSPEEVRVWETPDAAAAFRGA